MTLGGWITFFLSYTIFTLFFLWCVTKVLTSKPQKMMGNDMFEEDFFADDDK